MKLSKLIAVSSLLSALSLTAIAADRPCAPVGIEPKTLPPAHMADGVTYGPLTVSASPLAFYTFSISAGILPVNMALTNAYANHVDLAGEVVELGTFTFTMTARDPLTGCSGGRTFVVEVRECGDSIVDSDVGEVCDDGGTIDGDGCSANCLSDETCGNDYADLDEECDGQDLKGADCTTFGLINGVLGCGPATCQVDTSGCLTCGNGTIEPGEQCDGTNLQGFTCADLGFTGGVLACDPEMCVFDASYCVIGAAVENGG